MRYTTRLLSSVLAVLVVPAIALADGAKPSKKKKGDDDSSATVSSAAPAPADSSGKKFDPNNVTAISQFMDTCVQGNARYASRDFAAAIAFYQRAIQFNPKQPLGHYLLGEAQLAAGNLAEADAAWQRAASESSDKDPALRARVLFVIADLKERQKKWDEAKVAWQAYLDWASSHQNANAFAASAQSRQNVIDAMTKQDKAYDAVRKRIADTKAGGVFTDLSK